MTFLRLGLHLAAGTVPSRDRPLHPAVAAAVEEVATSRPADQGTSSPAREDTSLSLPSLPAPQRKVEGLYG